MKIPRDVWASCIAALALQQADQGLYLDIRDDATPCGRENSRMIREAMQWLNANAESADDYNARLASTATA